MKVLPEPADQPWGDRMRSTFAPVGPKLCQQLRTQHHVAIAVALGVAHVEHSGAAIHVLEPQPAGLADTQATLDASRSSGARKSCAA
jgi:hypothetical protein